MKRIRSFSCRQPPSCRVATLCSRVFFAATEACAWILTGKIRLCVYGSLLDLESINICVYIIYSRVWVGTGTVPLLLIYYSTCSRFKKLRRHDDHDDFKLALRQRVGWHVTVAYLSKPYGTMLPLQWVNSGHTILKITCNIQSSVTPHCFLLLPANSLVHTASASGSFAWSLQLSLCTVGRLLPLNYRERRMAWRIQSNEQRWLNDRHDDLMNRYGSMAW